MTPEPGGQGTPAQRWLARLSLVLAALAVVIVVVVAGLKSLAMLAVGAVAAAVSLAAGYVFLSRRGVLRWLALAVFVLAPVAVIVVYAFRDLLWVAVVAAAAWLGAGLTGRLALTGSPATPTTAGVAVGGNGDVWVWTDWATDFSGYEYAMVYAVLPGAAKPDVLSTAGEPGTLTTDGTHAYFLVASKNSLGASLMEATSGPQASSVAAAPTQALVGFSQSQVVLYAQPDSLYTYTPGAAGTTVVTTHAALPVWVAGTSSGLLFLTCSKQACSTVTQVNQSSGTTVVSVAVPANSDILLGPDPVVVGVESGHLHLVRLS